MKTQTLCHPKPFCHERSAADSLEIAGVFSWGVLAAAAADAELEPAVKAVLLAADSTRAASVHRLAVPERTTCGGLQAQISKVLEKYASQPSEHALRPTQALRYYREVLVKIIESEAAVRHPELKPKIPA